MATRTPHESVRQAVQREVPRRGEVVTRVQVAAVLHEEAARLGEAARWLKEAEAVEVPVGSADEATLERIAVVAQALQQLHLRLYQIGHPLHVLVPSCAASDGEVCC